MNNLLPAERPFIKTVPRRDWLKSDETPKYDKHKPARIVVHHSAAPTAKQFHGDQTIQAIHRYHTVDNKWSDIGYHFLISPDGSTIFEGRPVDAIGAHCGGNPPAGVTRNFGNTGSIGICLIGVKDFTHRQFESLRTLVTELCIHYGLTAKNVVGHYETPKAGGKTCPNFDMKAFRDSL